MISFTLTIIPRNIFYYYPPNLYTVNKPRSETEAEKSNNLINISKYLSVSTYSIYYYDDDFWLSSYLLCLPLWGLWTPEALKCKLEGFRTQPLPKAIQFRDFILLESLGPQELFKPKGCQSRAITPNSNKDFKSCEEEEEDQPTRINYVAKIISYNSSSSSSKSKYFDCVLVCPFYKWEFCTSWVQGLPTRCWASQP